MEDGTRRRVFVKLWVSIVSVGMLGACFGAPPPNNTPSL